jgi:enoyl-CoA hydratase/carnithine racemase
MSGPVSVTIDEAVATVVIDNPPVNAMSREVMAALGRTADDLAASDEIRAIVVTGAGTKAFMAGADIGEFRKILQDIGMEAHARWAGGVLEAWARMPQPVITCLQAPAVGGGLEFALAGDVIIAARSARVGLPEVQLGIIPAGGGTQRLAQRTGAVTARRLIMTAAVIEAEEARRLGIVDVVTDDGECLAAARDLARRLAGLPRLAVQAAKAATSPDLAEGLERERQLFLALTRSADFAEGAGAFLAGRRPEFVHR